MLRETANIRYRERDIEFDYVVLHFSDAEKNLCQYKLDNYDKDWGSSLFSVGSILG
jgi:hypothetical protein